MLKIKRTLTYVLDEQEVREFFDFDYWEDTEEVNDEDFDYFADSLIDRGYEDEEITYIGNTKEQMKKMWEEERNKAIKELEEDEKDYKDSIRKEIAELENRLEFLKARLQKDT